MNTSLLTPLFWFVQVARHKSYTKAANEMGVSRAAVSQSVKSLEAQLDLKLIYRTTRNMSLTESGERLYAQLQPSILSIQQAVASSKEISGTPSGKLRVNTSRLALQCLIEKHILEFSLMYPSIELEFVVEDGLSNIFENGCDVGVRLGQSLAEHVVAIPITPSVKMIVIGAPEYVTKNGMPKTVEELADHNCLNYRYPGTGAIREWVFNEPGKNNRHLSLLVRGNLVSNDNDTLINATLRGQGLMQSIDIAVKPYLTESKLVAVLPEWSFPTDGFYLYMPSRDHMPAKVRVFADFLKAKRALYEREDD